MRRYMGFTRNAPSWRCDCTTPRCGQAAKICSKRRSRSAADYKSSWRKSKMKLRNAATTVFCVALLGAAVAAPALADEWNRKTTVTFSAPVEIPGVHLKGWGVLPAGTYVFKIMDSLSDRHIVQIFNADETTLYATILAIP